MRYISVLFGFWQGAAIIFTTIMRLTGCDVEDTKKKIPSDALESIPTVSIQPVGVPQPVNLNELFPPSPKLSPEADVAANKNHTQPGKM